MSIKQIFNNYSIYDVAALPLSKCKILKEYLIKDFTKSAYVIIFLMPYYTGKKSNLSSFAAVPDYHNYANIVSSEITNYIKTVYSKNAQGFADHSPIDEINAAALCDLGIIGDNGLLITSKYSSFICIGEIVCELTNEQLLCEKINVVEEGDIKYCEHCALCKNSCPANSINDKAKCLSNISQSKKDLTEKEKELFIKGEYIWGCDICQLSCPHSKDIEITPINYFKKCFIEKMTLDKLESLSDEEYKTYTFSWRNKEIMKRNIILKGENSSDG